MECGNGVSITTTNANTTIPHYLLPSSGSCHDICKYGRRRPLQEEQDNCKPFTFKKRSGRLISNQTNSQREEEAKSISPKAKSQNTSEKPLAPKMPVQCRDAKRRRRNDDGAHDSVKNTKKNIWMPVGAASGSRKRRNTERKELLSTHKEQKSPLPPPHSSSPFHFRHENIAQMEIEKVETEKNESVTENTPSTSSSSCYGEEDGESDKLIVPRKKKNTRKKEEEVIKSESRPTKLKFRIRNSIHLHQENNFPRRHKFRRIIVESSNSDDSISINRAMRIHYPNTLRSRDKNCPSKSRRRRVRYGKTRILVLEKREGDRRRKSESGACSELLSKKKQLHHHDLQRKKEDVQVLFNDVIEETVSKLAERRKGTVKSLVGAFETLISLQARPRFFRVAATASVSSC